MDRQREASLRRFLQAHSLIPLILGLLLAGEGIRLLSHRVELGIPDETAGPDAYLIVIGGLIVCCALAESFTAGLRSGEKSRLDPKQKEALTILGLFVAYVVLLPLLGFTFSTASFFLSFALWVPKYSWVKAGVMATLVTLSYYIVFWKIAQVVLPRGIIGF
jgi:hypothetical protein